MAFLVANRETSGVCTLKLSPKVSSLIVKEIGEAYVATLPETEPIIPIIAFGNMQNFLS